MKLWFGLKSANKNVAVTKKSSNATSENFLKSNKSDKILLKIPLVAFIETLSDRIRNLEKECANGIISSDNKDSTAAERKKIERLITNEYSENEDNQPTIKVEKEKWGDKRWTKKTKVHHQPYFNKPKQKVVFSTSKVVTAKKVKEEKSNDFSLQSAFINYQKHYWKDVAVSSPKMKICQNNCS